MTPEEQRIAIAEWCGWERCYEKDINGQFEHRFWNHPKRGGIIFKIREHHLPDYLNDLNAMHEAERKLTEKQQVWYLQKLAQVRLREGVGGTIACMLDKLAFATATQRAEALLRTIGKWRESKGKQ